MRFLQRGYRRLLALWIYGHQRIPGTGGLTLRDMDWMQQNLQARAREDLGPIFTFHLRDQPRQLICRTCHQPVLPTDRTFYWETVRYPQIVSHWHCARPDRNVLLTLLGR